MHTPTPWEVRGQFIGPRLAPDSGIQIKVARVAGLDEEADANAEFIVRACNSHAAMLEALEAINRRGSPKPDRTLGDCADELQMIVDIARAAISKATGR